MLLVYWSFSREWNNSTPTDHWVKHLFLAHTYLELQLNEQALEIYYGLQAGGLQVPKYQVFFWSNTV